MPRHPDTNSHVQRSSRGNGRPIAAVLAFFCCLSPTLAWAIPSPELVIGSLSSASQLVTLLTAVLGGGAALAGVRAGRPSLGHDTARRSLSLVIGLLVLAFALSLAFAIHQWQASRQAHTERLEATLLRPAQSPGVPDRDPSLKELSFNGQLKHPLGMSTADADALLTAQGRGEASDVAFIDVRETAESEMGNLTGATAIRYPDFSPARIDLQGKLAVLFCHNGNRSHETCEALAAKGIPCRFIIGGLEKWVVEKRRMTGLATRSLGDLRAIPAYANQRTLLDTANVHDLIRKDKAIFVDVRYSGEFAAGHLPGAVNLPIRRLSTEILKSEIAHLPKRPVVLPCYDRRGCFFAEVLGLELSRAGHDVRGRYTVPFEYFIASGRPPHVEQWIRQNQRSLWSQGVEQSGALVTWLANQTGLLAAIFLMALGSRLLVLPLSLKAERDQIKTRALATEMTALKQRYAADPYRRARAIRALYARHGLTPGRNLLALLFLPLMTLSIAGVQQAASTTKMELPWLPDLAARDPALILPALFAALVATYLCITIARTRRQRIATWLIGMPVMMATGALLSAAVDIYLVASASLLLLQRSIVAFDRSAAMALIRARRIWLQRRLLPAGVITLDDTGQLKDCGNKAYRLAQLRAEGVDVPGGLVLTSEFLQRFEASPPAVRKRLLDRLWRRLGATRIAVRSSASAEDGDDNSFAGVFESKLDVDRMGMETAIVAVKASFATARSASYGVDARQANILLQRMVHADYAGVLFTRDPSSAGAALIELVQGTAEKLVSGAAAPSAFRFGRYTLAPMSEAKEPEAKESEAKAPEAKAPIDLAPLLAIGRRAERFFGAPQDIEWTYRQGRFQIVQSRNITRLHAGDQTREREQKEWARLLERVEGSRPDAVVFAQNELSEMLPRPTPLSLDVMQRFWSEGGSIDRACQRLGLAYRVGTDAPSYLLTVAGRLFIDKRQEKTRAPTVSAAAVKRLEKSADMIERDFRHEFLPAFSDKLRLLEAADFSGMPTAELFTVIERLRDSFVLETHVEVDIINIAASILLERAKSELGKCGLDPALCLARVPQSAAAQAISQADGLNVATRRHLLRARFGHRAVLDYELSAPRYAEDDVALKAYLDLAASTANHRGRGDAEDPVFGNGNPTLEALVVRARRFQTLKEDAKDHSLRELAALRRAVLSLDDRLGLRGLVFHLTFDELLALRTADPAAARDQAYERMAEAEIFNRIPPPQSSLTLRQLELAASGRDDANAPLVADLAGTRVSGSQTAEGRACVVSAADAERGAPIDGFRPGDVIVARMFHTAWLPYLNASAGIVCELGGWLSHMALLARENDIPMIVGTRGLAQIPSGARIRLHKNGGVELMAPIPVGLDQ